MAAPLDELLRKMIEVSASDLHLKVGSPPVMRIDGELHPTSLPVLSPQDTETYAEGIFTQRGAKEFRDLGEADFAYGKAELGRFRVNVFRQRGSVGLVMRRVQTVMQSFDELGLPRVLEKLALEQRGLVLVTGPTGSGKTTTLAAMIDYMNENRSSNIVTIEDPIEVLHSDKSSIVSQREIGMDTRSFSEALKRVLRQDPDVILIGEMRDSETVQAALQAAETGHLVLSTLHTIDSTETINRIVDFFPPYQQKQTRLLLAGAMRGVVSQRLLEAADGGRVPAIEVLTMNGRVFDRIVDEKQTHSLEDVIKESEFYGMQTFDQAILNLFK
ncbi:MAG: PilT/PilU family type 4a pilus ATPase, partial [Acidimicrobiia bacterium]|nr:PilT/PilU family type 4a pilus ATPase [Acidimicrobiia bacterium]